MIPAGHIFFAPRCAWRIYIDGSLAQWYAAFKSALHLKECAPPAIEYQKLFLHYGKNLASAPCSESDLCVKGVDWSILIHNWSEILRDQFQANQEWHCTISFSSTVGGYYAMRFSLLPLYYACVQTGGLPFHAGLIEHSDTAVLLAARSGVGKSTACRRLPVGWRALCDDEALVLQHEQDGYQACPLPTWSALIEKGINSWDMDRTGSLKRIFFLDKSDRDFATPLTPMQSATLYTKSADQVFSRYWPAMQPDDKRLLRSRIFSNACCLSRSLPGSVLHLTRYGDFWRIIEDVLDKTYVNIASC